MPNAQQAIQVMEFLNDISIIGRGCRYYFFNNHFILHVMFVYCKGSPFFSESADYRAGYSIIKAWFINTMVYFITLFTDNTPGGWFKMRTSRFVGINDG